MKKMLLCLAIAAAFLTGSVAARADEVPPAGDKPIAGYNGGFFIQNPEGSYNFKINGRFQPRIYFEKSANMESQASFMIRRARIDFNATMANDFSFGFSLSHSTSSSKFKTVNILGAIASYSGIPEFVISAGMVGLPLSIGGDMSSLGLMTLEGPLVMSQVDGGNLTPIRREFGNPDGLGLNFSGDIGKFYYAVSVINGATKVENAGTPDVTGSGVESNYDLDFNKRISAGARFAFHIFDPVGGYEMDIPYSEKPKLTVSVGGNYQGKRTDPTTAAEIKRLLTGSGGAAFRWRGFALNAEGFVRRTSFDSLGTAPFSELELDDLGYYIDASYFFIPNKLEVNAIAGQIFREGPHNDSYEFGGGVNWYINGTPKLKMQLQYTLTGRFDDVTALETTKTSLIGLQMTAAF